MPWTTIVKDVLRGGGDHGPDYNTTGRRRLPRPGQPQGQVSAVVSRCCVLGGRPVQAQAAFGRGCLGEAAHIGRIMSAVHQARGVKTAYCDLN